MSKFYANKCQSIVERYKAGDKEAINELPQYIDKMIYSLLKPYKLYPDKDDMYQVAWQAVMKCIERYDVTRETMFTTFAYTAIKRELRQYRKRIDKHKNDYTEEGEPIFEILPLDAYIVTQADGKTRLASINNIVASDTQVEDRVLVHEIKTTIAKVLSNYTNDKQSAIIADYLLGIKGIYIAYQYNVSSAYVSRVVRDFFNKVKKELNI